MRKRGVLFVPCCLDRFSVTNSCPRGGNNNGSYVPHALGPNFFAANRNLTAASQQEALLSLMPGLVGRSPLVIDDALDELHVAGEGYSPATASRLLPTVIRPLTMLFVVLFVASFLWP
jgi:hypothetical protein